MDLTDVDLGILTFLADNPSSTSTKIANNIFKPADYKELIKIDTMLRYRLNRLDNLGLVDCQGAPRHWRIDRKRILFGHGILQIDVENKKPLDLDTGLFLVAKGDGETVIKSLEAYEIRWGLSQRKPLKP